MAAILFFVFRSVMFACLLARLFSEFCFVYIVSSSPFQFLGFLGAFFLSLPLDFFSYHFQCVARRRRRRHHAPPPLTSLASPPLTQFYASALLDALFSVYLHFESVCGKNPKTKMPTKSCRWDGGGVVIVASRRVDTLRCQSCVNYAIKLSFTRFRAACSRA